MINIFKYKNIVIINFLTVIVKSRKCPIMILVHLITLSSIIFLLTPKLTLQDECVPSSLNPQACMCNSTHCDDTPSIDWCSKESKLQLYVTSDNGDRLRRFVTHFHFSANEKKWIDATIHINPCKKYQTIIGFGGAMTDAAALMISCLSDGAKKNFMDSYFDCDRGLGYDLLRVPLGGADYSESKYTYDDTAEPDVNLEHFALNEMDTKYKIPLIKLAQSISCRNIRLKGATWIAPDWMLDRKSRYEKNFIKPEYEETWAIYHLKALEEYESHGTPITFLSAGNEVEVAALSNAWELERYKNWVTNTLCPILKNKVKLLALDDQTVFLPQWMKILEDPITRECLTGFATHWYLDFIPGLTKPIQENFCLRYPEQILISSESSVCEYEPTFNTTTDWQKAERYANDIIEKISSCGQAYIDWNLALDLQGGPNWQENYCYAAVKVDCSADEFYKNILFYVLGHFSKFVPEGSIRVEASVRSFQKNLTAVAFRVKTEECAKGNLVSVILNRGDIDLTTNVCVGIWHCATINVPKRSITTTVSTIPSHLKCL